jgi:predicted transcriptional regulator
MQKDDFRILTIFYNRLKSVIEISDRNTPHGSILLPFLEMKKNARYRILCSVSLPVNSVSETIIQSLVENELVAPGDELDHYRITARGIWVVEQKKEI